MSEKYIVEGPALAKLLRENRIRVARGELTFTPLVDGDEKKTELDDKENKDIPPVETMVPAEEKDGGSPSEESKEMEVEDTKDVVADDSKDVAPIEDSKDVAPIEDTKEVAPEEEKKTAPKKSKK